jgi:sortase A
VLAFGPGHRTGSALPGEAGNSVVSAHRDTHFAVLEQLALGDLIQVQSVAGAISRYRVDHLEVVDEHDLWVTGQHGIDQLSLVTCWPFHGVAPGGPQRYVVLASRIDDDSQPAARSRKIL